MPDRNPIAEAAYRYIRHERKMGYEWPWSVTYSPDEQQDRLNLVHLVRALVDAGYPLKTMLRELEWGIPKERLRKDSP